MEYHAFTLNEGARFLMYSRILFAYLSWEKHINLEIS